MRTKNRLKHKMPQVADEEKPFTLEQLMLPYAMCGLGLLISTTTFFLAEMRPYTMLGLLAQG